MKEQQERYDLPKDWIWVKIEDISLRIHYGYTASATKENTGIKLLRITDIQDNKVKWEKVPFCDIKPDDVGKYELMENDLVFARTGATVGKSFLIPKNIPKAVFASYLIRINLSKQLSSKYIYFFFQSVNYWRQISAKAIGSGQPNVNANSLSNILLPLCGIDEQNRIVLMLEEQISGLEKSKEQLIIILSQLKVYRQSILKTAYNGQLTKKWRSETTENTSKNNLPAGWYYKELSKTVSHRPKRLKASSDSRLKFIGLDSIEPNTLYPSSIHNFSDYKSSAIYFTKDHVLYGRMRPYLNKVWKADFEGACSGEFLVLECSDMILPDYLKYKLHSMDFVAFASERSSGDRPRVSFDKISDFQIPLCSVEEQIEIVRIIDHHFSNADKINSWVIEALEKLEVLEKVILRHAFEGKLTYQNIHEESTSALLENIKKEIDTYLSEETLRKKSLPKSIIMTDKPKTIIELLRESNVPVSSDKVWQNCDMKDDIDGFYAELKKYVEEGTIEEIPRKGKESFLKLVDKNEN
ncbi:restriction endonuclease subunit S [Chryseobacterium profundimaris]|uniref:Type I restriction enzyme, S subunit n=1 Tax=Chryseobacterium profundimaris TaxID=1387275 RepID=A0ABY1NXC9_9FLAO|nr:restriction endonuclease subunit S [Chryseobacterium profundimaris]SMP20593.1 type I restriction enzyme, S subunit [Chryseobacterium profundimaris]